MKTLDEYFPASVLSLSAWAELDRSRIRASKSRLIVSGNNYELYTYSNPYFYNKSPSMGSCCSLDSFGDMGRRADNLHSARQRIRRLINSNVNQYGQYAKFVTYTFKDNVTDLSSANATWRKYCKRLARAVSKNFQYLAVVEFQKRGAVHYHVVYFDMPFISKAGQYLEKIWGQGSVNVKAIKQVKNLGGYVCKYLQKEIMDSRLKGQKAFFGSRGLKEPVELKSETSIATILQKCMIIKEVERDYTSSTYGRIFYQQGQIKQLKQSNDS